MLAGKSCNGIYTTRGHWKTKKASTSALWALPSTGRSGLSLHPVNYPEKQPILVNQDHATKCPTEPHDVSWLGKKIGYPKRKTRRRIRQSHLPSRLDINFVNDHETPKDVHCAEPRITDY